MDGLEALFLSLIFQDSYNYKVDRLSFSPVNGEGVDSLGVFLEASRRLVNLSPIMNLKSPSDDALFNIIHTNTL